MVDYTRGTGEAGTMLIRDHGNGAPGNVEYLLRSGYSSTFVGQLPWSGYINGQGPSGTVNYPSGSPWVSCLNWYVDGTQDVRFSIGATGTSGFGGPTDFWQRIDRTPPVQPPGAPTNLQVTNLGHTTAGISYNRGAENGGGILQDEATWYYPGGEVVWNDPNCAGYTSPNDGQTPGAPKLNQYREYHIYIRSRNSAGWGPSAAIAIRTLASGQIKFEGSYRPFVRYVKVDGVYREAIPYVKDNGAYKASRN